MSRIVSRKFHRLNRRTLLRGALGTGIALPWLEGFQGSASAQQTTPRRLVIFIHANGVMPEQWFPDTPGPDYEIKFSLEPLAPFKQRMIMLGGVDTTSAMDKKNPSGHTLGAAHLLTCNDTTRDGQFDGIGYANSISFDQALANHIGKDTALKSLNTGFQCDTAASGEMPRVRYSYADNDQPIIPQHRPQLVFDQISGLATPTDPASQAQREAIRKRRLSVLDLVAEDLQDTSSQLGSSDRARLDEYLTQVRAVEVAVGSQVALSCDPPMPPGETDFARDENLPAIAGQMLQLTQFALQCDMTRVSVFQIKGEQSYVKYSRMNDPIVQGISGSNHHDISHHPNDDIAKICKLHSKFLADFATGLDAVKEGDRTLLDNTVILYTNAIQHGGKHNFDNLPHVLLGGRDMLAPGHYAKFDGRSNNDLFVTLFKAFGIDQTTFGDPTLVQGELPGILA